MERIVFQPIRTPEGYYIYDQSVNTIFAVFLTTMKNLNQIQDKMMLTIFRWSRFSHMGLLGEKQGYHDTVSIYRNVAALL